MPKTIAFADSLLALYFNAAAVANVADNAGTSPLTNIYVSLHTAEPGTGGNQTSSEVSYTGYARQPVARTSGGWTVSTNQAQNAATISFPKSTGVADNTTAAWFGVGRSSAGAGTLDYWGPLGTLLGAGSASSSTNQVTIPGLTGASVGDKVAAMKVPSSPLPGGVSEGTTYFIKTLASDVITLSATSGGATLTITSDGEAFWVDQSTLQITQNVQPTINAGQATVTEY